MSRTLALLAGPALAAEARGELRVAIPWTPETLDPTMNLASIRAAVGVSLFDSLVGRDAENRIVPELAESWKLLDDLTWQYTPIRNKNRGRNRENGHPCSVPCGSTRNSFGPSRGSGELAAVDAQSLSRSSAPRGGRRL